MDTAANRILATLPEFPHGHFAYRENSWPGALLGLALLTLGGTLAAEAFATADSALFAATLALIVAAAASIFSRPVPYFICAGSGLYFPALGKTGSDTTWLWVPWANVLAYRSQRLLDETSSQGLAISLRASATEEEAYLAPYRLFGIRHPAQRDEHICRLGFTCFSLNASEVETILRRHETASAVAKHRQPTTALA